MKQNRNKPHFFGHRRRLRERFLKVGLEGLADYEVVELLLTLAIPRSDVKKPAKDLISRFGNLREILDAPHEELQKIKGLGNASAAVFKIIKEIAILYLQQNSEGQEYLAEPDKLISFWRMRIGALSNEVFEVAYLDSSYRLLRDGVERLEEGTLDRAAIFPRRIIEAALKRGAYAIVLAHNHPNGVEEPSAQDKTLTRAIVLAAEAVGLKVLDHLIITVDGAFSFLEAGLL